MKKRNFLVTIAAIVMMFAFVACSENVTLEDKLGTITFENYSSRAVGTVVTYSNEAEEMVWFYSATKLDDGYTTGQTDGFVAVAAATSTGSSESITYSATKGLSGKTLNSVGFSYGLWKIELQGYKAENVEVSSDGKVTIKTNTSAEYTATIDNLLVNKGANYATAKIELGDNPETKIVFDTADGISFSSSNIKADSEFTLAVTDNKGTVTVATTGTGDVVKADGSVTFKNLTYQLNDNADITGEHTMNFVLTQTLKNTDSSNTATNTAIEAALYTLKFTVQKGTTTTISGTLLKNDVTGTVQINSVQDVEPLTLSKVMAVKDVDTTNNIAKVSEETKINYGDLEVVYPVGTVISTEEGSVEGSTSDAKIGFKYKETSTQEGISIEATESKMTFELTLSASTATDDTKKNSTLITVKKFIGKGLTISNIYHAGTKLDAESSEAIPTDGAEGYFYDSETGYLTLYVFHASEFNIVFKEPVATVGEVKYYSLSDAIEAVSAGGTVTLLRPITLSEEITVDKSITLDMARKAITKGAGAIKVGENGVVTVQNNASGESEFISGVAFSSSDSDGVFYPTFSKAIDSASNGGTITLFKDTTLNEKCTITKDLTIDLNKRTLTIKDETPFMTIGSFANTTESYKVTIKNGKMVTDRSNENGGSPVVFCIYLGGTLVLDNVEVIDSTKQGSVFSTMSISEYAGTEDYSSRLVIKNNSKITISGEGASAILGINSQETNKPTCIEIENSIIEATSVGSGAVCVGGYDGKAELNVKNSTLKGESVGLELGGNTTATVKDSTIAITQTEKKTASEEGDSPINAPISVDVDYGGDSTLTLSNVTLEYVESAIDGHVYLVTKDEFSASISGTFSNGKSVSESSSGDSAKYVTCD